MSFGGAQSTCCQPGFTQRLPTPAYGKHTLTHMHICTYARMRSLFLDQGVWVWQAAHIVWMSHLYAWMHCIYTFRHGYTNSHLQIYKDTQWCSHRNREITAVLCLCSQNNLAIKSNIRLLDRHVKYDQDVFRLQRHFFLHFAIAAWC